MAGPCCDGRAPDCISRAGPLDHRWRACCRRAGGKQLQDCLLAQACTDTVAIREAPYGARDNARGRGVGDSMSGQDVTRVFDRGRVVRSGSAQPLHRLADGGDGFMANRLDRVAKRREKCVEVACGLLPPERSDRELADDRIAIG